MHIVAIAWIFVVVLMAAAEATSPQGTVLGAVMTLLLYGALPLWIVMYLLGTPMRRKARRQAEATADAAVAPEAAALTEAPMPEEASAHPASATPPLTLRPGPEPKAAASSRQGDARGQAAGDRRAPE